MEYRKDIQEFIDLIETWSELSMDFNHSNTRMLNQLHDEYHQKFKRLREEDRLDEIIPFLYHPSKAVSNVIATYCLIHDEKLAIKRLEELSKESGLIGMGSKSNLEEWHRGNLHFDY